MKIIFLVRSPALMILFLVGIADSVAFLDFLFVPINVVAVCDNPVPVSSVLFAGRFRGEQAKDTFSRPISSARLILLFLVRIAVSDNLIPACRVFLLGRSARKQN